MPYSIRLPDGRVVGNIPDSVDPTDAKQRIIDAFPELSKFGEAKKPRTERPEDVGILEGAGAALKRGLESFGDIAAGYGLAGSKLFGEEESTRRRMEEIKKEQAEPPETPMMTVADFERIAAEKGVLEAAKEAPKYILEQLGLSGPQMAVPLAVGSGATALAAPTGPIIAPAIGIAAGIGAYGLQQFGNFLVTQAVEKNDPEELDIAKAAIAAGGTAPLGYFVDRFTAGIGSVGKNAGKEAAKELAARSIALQTGKRAAGGAAAGIIAEAPTEVLEQLAERWQAGKELTGDDAYRDYKEAFFGAAAVGGTIGGATRGYRGYRDVREARAAAEAEAAPGAPTPAESQVFNVIGADGNPMAVTVTKDQYGDILARDETGEEVDLTNMISRGVSIEDAVKTAFSFDEAPTPEPVAAPTITPAKPAGPELITPQMPDIPPRQVPTSYLPDREPAPPPPPPEPPKLLGYSPTAGQEPMYVFSDGSVAVGEEAAFNRRYEPQKLSPEELAAIEPELEPPDLEGVTFKPYKYPKLPITPEEEAALKEKSIREKEDLRRVGELERRYKALTSRAGKGESLRQVLAKQLNESEVVDLGTESYFKQTFGAGKNKGKTISDFVADGSLDSWIPPNLRIDQQVDTPEIAQEKEIEATEFIKDRIRNRNFLTYDAEIEAARIDEELRATLEFIEREAGFENLRDILTEIYEEEIATGFEPGISEYEGAVPAEGIGKTRIESAQREAKPGLGIAQRGINAANRFRDMVVEQFGLTPDQADRALGTLMKYKVVDLDPIDGQFKVKDGRFMDRNVLLRAAEEGGAKAEAVKRKLKNGQEITIETVSAPKSFSNLVRQEFGSPISLLAKDSSGKQIGRLTYMPKGGPIDIFVGEQNRRKGVATALYDELESRGIKIPEESKGYAVSEEAKEVRKSLKEREERAIADRERELFALQPQVPEKVGAPTGDLFGARGLTELAPKAPTAKPAPAAQLSLFQDDKVRVENKAGIETKETKVDPAEAAKIQKAIEGKTALQVAKWVSYNDPSPARRLIAKRIINRMEKLMDAGVKFNFKVAHLGDKVPRVLNNARGLCSSILSSQNKLESVDIWVNGADVTGRIGTNYVTVLHELSHSVTAAANYIGGTTAMRGTNSAVLSKRLIDLSNAVIKHYNNSVKEFKAGNRKLTEFEQRIYEGANALDNTDEVLAWGLASKEMQDYLESIPYKGKTLWNEFVTAIRKYLGLAESQETALSELLSISDEMLAEPLIEVGEVAPGAAKPAAPKAPIPTAQQIRLFNAEVAGLNDTQRGDTALKIVDALGRGLEPPKTNVEKVREFIFDDKGNVKLTPEAAKKAATNWMDKVETWAFSSDAALNNAIRRDINNTTKSQQEKIGVLLSISSSQEVHADAVASLFMRYGGIKYNPEIYKYEAVDNKDNFIDLAKRIGDLAKKYKMTNEQAQRVSHTAFEARRLRSLQEYNEKVDSQIENLRARMRQAKADGDEKVRYALQREVRRKLKDYKFIHMSDDEINAGLKLIELMPKEMNGIIDVWNQIRLNAARELVDSGLWSLDEAIALLSNIDYVPFYREEQIEQGKGPKEFLRGLEVQAKEKKLKGSKLPVNDVFDNMVRWTQYAVKRSVMNRLGVAKIDAAVDAGMAKQVGEREKDTVRVWRNGVPEFYKLDDPMFMDAFAGLESVAIPTWKAAAEVSNFLRRSVVLNPLFSLSQVPQDAFAAIYTSGLKPRYALSIPVRAVKEFVKTLFKASQTHKQLERVAAVGIKDFSSAIARKDVEVMAGLKAPPGVWGKVKNFLEHISMASDNAVRQAVYEASVSQGLSRAESLEKAFQLINFKNKGSSKFIQMLGQVVPFFNAYLAAQHVALKVVSGVGISPVERKEALKTLIYTTAAVQTLALLYSMAMDDDEDYKNTPSIIRDRLLMIPGTGMSIPLRPDIFAIPKILTEHTYMLMTNQGSEDGRKFRDSIKAALGNAFFGPTPVPQVVKPIVEVGMNYNFFQGRPLVGTYQKGLEVERQFNDSTSELAKVLGKNGIVSPIAIDHLIRGMFGSVGGLSLLMTNQLIHNDPNSPRPEMTTREVLAALPGTSGFVRREYETGIKNDFYVLRDEVSKAVNTLNDMKARSPQDIEEFLADEKNINRIGLQKATNKITQNLSKIRREISRIRGAEGMTAKEKQDAIRELQEVEQQMLSGIDIKELRRIAQL